MAIVKMNKFTLLTLRSNKEKLLKKLQEFSNVQFINLQDEDYLEKKSEFKGLIKDKIDSQAIEINEKVLEIESVINFLSKFMPKKSGIKAFEDDKECLSISELEELVESCKWEKICNDINEYEKKLLELESEIIKYQGEINLLSPWENLNVTFQELRSLRKSSYILGSISKQYESKLLDVKDSYIEILSRNSSTVNLLMLFNRENEKNILNSIREFAFVPFKTKYDGEPKKIIKKYEENIRECEGKLINIKEEIASKVEEFKMLKLVYDYYVNKLERKNVSQNFLKSNHTFIIQGWCPIEVSEDLRSICDKELKNDYLMFFEDVADDEIDYVPIKLKNNKLNRTFESITQMYSYPKYNEVDPTPLLAPFYLIFFGMMVADAGYGLVMLISTILALKLIKLSKKNEDFVRFFYYLSFPTILFGLIYGSVFGDAVQIPKLIDTSKDITSVLILSIALGVIQIFFGLGIKAYMLIKIGKIKDAFYDVGSWIITLVSAGILGVSSAFGFPEVVKNISIVGLILGSIIIVLTGGREEKTKGAQIGQGLYALYGISSYVGDLVSYTRLMALGLAGGSIAGALNLLINQLPSVAAIVVAPILFVLLHIFNLLLSLLGAYVHTARLQYVEYFSKFYEGGGKLFTPFELSEKYINIKRK